MVINLGKYSVIFLVSVILQALIFNNILIAKVITPYFYIIFLLLLPFDTPRSMMLVFGFLLGVVMDIFTNTPGVHAATCVMLAFLRPTILQLISSRETIESVMAPRVENMGLQWFATYTASMVFVHHLFLFFIEAFTFDGMFFTLIRIIFSAILSALLITLSQFLIFRN